MLKVLAHHHSQRQQPSQLPLLPGMPSPIMYLLSLADLCRSVSIQVSTVTITPSERAVSAHAGSQTTSAQASNVVHLSAGAISGIVIGAVVACVLLFVALLLYYRRRCFKPLSQRLETIDDTIDAFRPGVDALPELSDRDRKRPEMSQAAPEIRFIPADETTVASPSGRLDPRSDNSNRFRTTTDTDGNRYDLRVTTDNGSPTFGSIKDKGKGRRLNSETPISASTTLVSSSASPRLLSQWERPSMDNPNHSQARTTLRPDSAL